MKDPEIIDVPGQVRGLAAADPDGPIYLTSYAGRSPSTRNLYTTVLTAVDLAGGRLWQRTYASHPFPPRADADGTVWVAHHDGYSTPVSRLPAEPRRSGRTGRACVAQVGFHRRTRRRYRAAPPARRFRNRKRAGLSGGLVRGHGADRASAVGRGTAGRVGRSGDRKFAALRRPRR